MPDSQSLPAPRILTRRSAYTREDVPRCASRGTPSILCHDAACTSVRMSPSSGVTRVFAGGALCTSPNRRKTSERASARDRNGSKSSWLDDSRQSFAGLQHPLPWVTKTPIWPVSSRGPSARPGKKKGSEGRGVSLLPLGWPSEPRTGRTSGPPANRLA